MDPTEEEDPLCECEHVESKHMKNARFKGGDYCRCKDHDEELDMEVCCLCKKFVKKGDKSAEPTKEPAKRPSYETEE